MPETTSSNPSPQTVALKKKTYFWWPCRLYRNLRWELSFQRDRHQDSQASKLRKGLPACCDWCQEKGYLMVNPNELAPVEYDLLCEECWVHPPVRIDSKR